MSSIELDSDAMDGALEELEKGMGNAKAAHSHDDIRPSTAQMGQNLKKAYRTLVEAHPDYELSEGNDE